MRIQDSFLNLKVTVVGLGHFGGGVGVSRWLRSQGAKVTVTDQADAAKLADSVSQLSGLDITFHLGGHDENDFTQADLLVVNPAVPKEIPLLKATAQAGVPRTSAPCSCAGAAAAQQATASARAIHRAWGAVTVSPAAGWADWRARPGLSAARPSRPDWPGSRRPCY